MKNKALILLSGGLDSATLLSYIISKKQFDSIEAINVFYGQKHSKEQKYAKKIADYYKIPIKYLDLTNVFEMSDCPLLSKNNKNIPQKSYKNQLESQEVVETYVPFRNGVFLSVVASIAYSRGCNYIFYAAHLTDSKNGAYPDCSEEFIKASTKAIYLGTGRKVKLQAPFKNLEKSEIVKIGLKLKVPYNLTWSCYNSYSKPCGKCATCIERREAFLKNKAVDPMKSRSEIKCIQS